MVFPASLLVVRHLPASLIVVRRLLAGGSAVSQLRFKANKTGYGYLMMQTM